MTPGSELSDLLAKRGASGGVLDYVFLRTEVEGPPESLHRAAALAGMSALDHRLKQWKISRASREDPIDLFFPVPWDEAKLTGEPVSFSTFWGTDDIEPKPIGDHASPLPPELTSSMISRDLIRSARVPRSR